MLDCTDTQIPVKSRRSPSTYLYLPLFRCASNLEEWRRELRVQRNVPASDSDREGVGQPRDCAKRCLAGVPHHLYISALQ